MSGFQLLIILVVVFYFISGIRVIPQYKRMVVLRLGKYSTTKSPGLTLLLPFIDRGISVDIRTTTMNINPQEIITKDNISVSINGAAYCKVVDPAASILEIESWESAVFQITQTALRGVCGQREFDEILSERDDIAHSLQKILDEQTEQWGIKIQNVELMDIKIPPAIQSALALQAEAERSRRAKLIRADGEIQAANKLKEAADILGESPNGLFLRYLETIKDVGDNGNNNNTILMPLPDFLYKIMGK